MSSLIDPPMEKDAARRAVSLARSRKDIYIYACFSENKFARPSAAYVRTYVRTFLLRPCGADRRMRFSRAPAYPSRDYLGRESSSLPRSFPSLLPIRGGSARFPPERGNRSRARRALTRSARGQRAASRIALMHMRWHASSRISIL